jgi:hypothetical protein
MLVEEFFDELAIEGIILGPAGIKALLVSVDRQRIERIKVDPIFLLMEHLKERPAILLKTNDDTALRTGQFLEFLEPGSDRSQISKDL